MYDKCNKVVTRFLFLENRQLGICYEDKLPIAWGVPQQTALTLEINIFQYARETKHLTLRDIESYLVLDG